MSRSILVSAALVLAAGCYHGPGLGNFEPAHSPEGIAADLHLRKTRVRGELLAVQDSALIVLADPGGIVMVPVDSIRLGSFGDLGPLLGESGDVARSRERLRLLSRFPAGLTAELRTRLLAAYGQREIQVVQ
ncbi:MAG TPA: hypothetical protein VEK83_02705 [Gemmatimonadales bacterium]|nr:hypothetical protein [Gemmatimonadales bacterium]